MQLKVFQAKDMASGLKMVRESFGPEALILSVRTLRKARFGIFGTTTTTEIIAGLGGFEDHLSVDRRGQIIYQESMMPACPGSFASNGAGQKECGKNMRDQLAAVSPALHEELARLQHTVQGLSSRVASLDNSPLRHSYVEPEFVLCGKEKVELGTIQAFLASCGCNPEVCRMIAHRVWDRVRNGGAEGKELDVLLKETLARQIVTRKYPWPSPFKQRCISLVGPTGVGKTTTIAKIAATHRNRFGGRIAFITLDTYRVAAVEQLKVYGEIMDVPMEVVVQPEHLGRALEKFRDYDLVLIDTTGRSPRSASDLQNMGAMLRPYPQIEHHLLLSASARERELEETIRSFSVLPLFGFLFTKIDECEQLGVLFNIHCRYNTPISFLANGQKVPEDLVNPSPTDVAALVIDGPGVPCYG